MKISKGSQKTVLSLLFYEVVGEPVNGVPQMKPKQFKFDKLMDAASAAKKINAGAEEKDKRLYFTDDEIEFTPDERSLLKELFDNNKDNWDITVVDTVLELIELFKK